MNDQELAVIANDIAYGGDPQRILAWLKSSWEEPERFYAGVAYYTGGRGRGPLKSRCFDSYDFYHDLVLRHLSRGSEAIVSWEPGAGLTSATYDELHEASNRLVGTWVEAGVVAGECVAIVLNTGVDYTVAFLTALRMGLVVSVLPPVGPSMVGNRLTALAPDYVVSHPRYSVMLPEQVGKLLPSSGGILAGGASVRSHTYAAKDPVARLFSPLSATPEIPVERTADALYLPMMRDSALVLGIGSGDRLAIPGFDPLQFQPWALMISLLAGACFVAVDERSLAREEISRVARLTIAGVSPELRDRVLAREVDPTGWRAWFLNPTQPYGWEQWYLLANRLAVDDCFGSNLVVSAALGGTFLFSPRRATLTQLAVYPAPGQPWQLSDLAGSGEPTFADSGIYTALGEDADESTFNRFVIARTREGWVYAGSMVLGKDGQTYPAREIVGVVEAHPEVDAACIVIMPASELLNKTRVILAVFIDPSKEPTEVGARLRAELERRMIAEMGGRWLPEQIRFYPLVPRKVDGVVDENWCRWELSSGALDKKSRDELFRLIATLEKIVAEPERRGA